MEMAGEFFDKVEGMFQQAFTQEGPAGIEEVDSCPRCIT
jgi:hypothetical protein